MSSGNRTCGIVVTYHPVAAHLENLRFLSPQVDHLIVVDNGSDAKELTCIHEKQVELGFTLIENIENMGMAYALNQGVAEAFSAGCDWINLFDQDSRITHQYVEHMVEDFQSLSKEVRLGLLVPRYQNPVSGDERFFREEGGGGPFVTITSGSLFSAGVLKACGPFEEQLFIYIVDDEYSLRVRLKGFQIAQSRRAVLLHVAGDPNPVRIFGKEIFVRTNHSAISRYYLNRNRVWLVRRYARAYPRFCARFGIYAFKESLKIVLAEDQKILKLRRTAQGIWDGLSGRMGKATF